MKKTKRIDTMYYLYAKHKVADFGKWKCVFDADVDAQRKAGLHVLHVLRDVDDPNLVILFFRVDDLAKARAFTENPEASEHGEISGVIGMPEVLWLNE